MLMYGKKLMPININNRSNRIFSRYSLIRDYVHLDIYSPLSNIFQAIYYCQLYDAIISKALFCRNDKKIYDEPCTHT